MDNLSSEILAGILNKLWNQIQDEKTDNNESYITGREWSFIDIRRGIIKELEKVNPSFDEESFIDATIK